jgi:hypothetical protein
MIATGELLCVRYLHPPDTGRTEGTAWAMERQYPEQFGRPEVRFRLKLAESVEKQNMSMWEWAERKRPLIAKLVDGEQERSALG